MQPSFLRVDIQRPLPGDLDPFCRDDMKEKTKRFQPSADRQEAERRRGEPEGEDQYPAKRPLREGKPPLWYRFFFVNLQPHYN